MGVVRAFRGSSGVANPARDASGESEAEAGPGIATGTGARGGYDDDSGGVVMAEGAAFDADNDAATEEGEEEDEEDKAGGAAIPAPGLNPTPPGALSERERRVDLPMEARLPPDNRAPGALSADGVSEGNGQLAGGLRPRRLPEEMADMEEAEALEDPVSMIPPGPRGRENDGEAAERARRGAPGGWRRPGRLEPGMRSVPPGAEPDNGSE